MSRIELITGPERRRQWSEEQKRAIVAETLEPGAVVAEVARRIDVCTDLIYRWRSKIQARGELPCDVRLREDPGKGFARVLVAPPERLERPPEEGAGCCAAPAIEIEFAGTARLRFPASIPMAVVKALAQRSSRFPLGCGYGWRSAGLT